jgi:CHASE3 domain sensor protein
MRIATRLSLISAGAACVILIVGFTSYITVAELIVDNKSFSHSREVLQELNLLLYNLSDTVNSQRNYMITAQDAYLDAYKALISSTYDSLGRIKTLVSDNPAQSLKVEKLNSLVRERLASLEITNTLYQQKGVEAAFQRVRTGPSFKFRIALHKSMDEIRAQEIDLLQIREKELKRGASSAQLTIIAGTCLVMTLLILFSYLFGRYISNNMSQLIKALDNMNYNRFGLSIPTNSNDEFSELGCAFNAVSSQLLTMSNELTKRQEEIAAIMEELHQQANNDHNSEKPKLGLLNKFNNVIQNTSKHSADIQKSIAGLPAAVDSILNSWQDMLEKNGSNGSAHAREPVVFPSKDLSK